MRPEKQLLLDEIKENPDHPHHMTSVFVTSSDIEIPDNCFKKYDGHKTVKLLGKGFIPQTLAQALQKQDLPYKKISSHSASATIFSGPLTARGEPGSWSPLPGDSNHSPR